MDAMLCSLFASLFYPEFQAPSYNSYYIWVSTFWPHAKKSLIIDAIDVPVIPYASKKVYGGEW